MPDTIIGWTSDALVCTEFTASGLLCRGFESQVKCLYLIYQSVESQRRFLSRKTNTRSFLCSFHGNLRATRLEIIYFTVI